MIRELRERPQGAPGPCPGALDTEARRWDGGDPGAEASGDDRTPSPDARSASSERPAVTVPVHPPDGSTSVRGLRFGRALRPRSLAPGARSSRAARRRIPSRKRTDGESEPIAESEPRPADVQPPAEGRGRPSTTKARRAVLRREGFGKVTGIPSQSAFGSGGPVCCPSRFAVRPGQVSICFPILYPVLRIPIRKFAGRSGSGSH